VVVVVFRYPDGGTNIPAAFDTAAQMFQNSSPGRRKYVTGIFILMTDGKTDFRFSLIFIYLLLHKIYSYVLQRNPI
jgi:hypothetical protein